MRSTLAKALLLAAALAAPAFAQTYPDRPIRMVVTYPPGGATDVIARAVSLRLGERLKQSVIVDNRPGATGMIGTEAVARSAPDGYTLIMAVADTHSMNPHIFANIRYDARKDFTPVASVGYLAYALVLNPVVKASTVPELVALAKTQPGKLTFASWGIGSSSQIAFELFKADAGINMLHVPFQGAAPAIAAVIGGQVDAMMVPLTLADPNHKAGKVRRLAVALQRRFSGSPDTPTFAEQGMPLVAGVWLGVLGPAGLPSEVVTTLHREITAVVSDPKTREQLVVTGLDPTPDTLANFRAFLDSEYERWGKTIRGANIRAE